MAQVPAPDQAVCSGGCADRVIGSSGHRGSGAAEGFGVGMLAVFRRDSAVKTGDADAAPERWNQSPGSSHPCSPFCPCFYLFIRFLCLTRHIRLSILNYDEMLVICDLIRYHIRRIILLPNGCGSCLRDRLPRTPGGTRIPPGWTGGRGPPRTGKGGLGGWGRRESTRCA